MRALRPCNQCGVPIENAELFCNSCNPQGEQDAEVVKTPPVLNQRESNLSFVLTTMSGLVLGAIVTGLIVGGLTLGVCIGIFSLPFSFSISIAMVVAVVAAAAVVICQFN